MSTLGTDEHFALEVCNLFRDIGGTSVLRDVGLSLKYGSLAGLVALNGSGKTTLLKAILGLGLSGPGDVKIFGVNGRKPSSRKNVFYLPEFFVPSPRLTCKQVIFWLLRLHSVQRKECEIPPIFEALDLDYRYYNMRVGGLSKGTLQKVGLACALLSQKGLLLLDEPMTGLDARARSGFLKAIKGYVCDGFCSDGGRPCVLLVSHILNDIERVCDKVLFLHNGTVSEPALPVRPPEVIHKNSLESVFLRFISE